MKNFKILKKPYETKNKSGLLVAEIDGNQCATLKLFYKNIAQSLHFPNYFGENLDALYDMMCDFSWLDAEEVHLVLKNYDNFLEKEPHNIKLDLLIILYDTVSEWKAMKGDSSLQFEVYVEQSETFKNDVEEALEEI